jgi:hypothetical protein
MNGRVKGWIGWMNEWMNKGMSENLNGWMNESYNKKNKWKIVICKLHPLEVTRIQFLNVPFLFSLLCLIFFNSSHLFTCRMHFSGLIVRVVLFSIQYNVVKLKAPKTFPTPLFILLGPLALFVSPFQTSQIRQHLSTLLCTFKFQPCV